MYTVPSAPQQWNTASSPTPASPTSPVRTGRLRGLSYLRTYTQNHILSRDSHNHSQNSSSIPPQRPSTLGRATSYPSPTSRGSAGPSSPTSPAPGTAPQQASTLQSPTAQRNTSDDPSARSNNLDSVGGTSGWLPTVGGQSAVSRIASEPQSVNTGSSSAVLSGNKPSDVTSDLTASMARTRSATTGTAPDMLPVNGGEAHSRPEIATVNANGGNQGMAHQLPSIRFSAHQDPRVQRPSLVFPAMSRILPTGKEIIKVGRYSERDSNPVQSANMPSSAPVGFKSKVVSRRHCEFWCLGGRWFIKDVKSSSGTFLNHIRLSSPGTESKPFPVNDGDVVQLGIDFKGGEEMIFRCVKIRVELNKGWQNGPSSFNVQSHKRLRELNSQGKSPAAGSSQDCSICLGPIAPCQSLFVAPCSHTWHYKCIRVIINGPHWPHFICPNCRTVADLEAELDDPYADGEWEELEAVDESDSLDAPQAAESEPTDEPLNLPNRNTVLPDDVDVLIGVQEHVEPEQNSHSDIELVEASDDSGPDRDVRATASSLGYLNINQTPSPSESVADSSPHEEDSHSHPISNATSAPVNIVRKAVGSHLCQPIPHPERRSTRTPSPNGTDTSPAGVEGPMTPRNDIGPFVFDGSAGRAAGLATQNLNAAANTPPTQAPPALTSPPSE
ncbi:related to dma1, component of spindle assembly checkpoint [Rhynchosporium agropyri]|uniref:RING-type E3 ubiquitin transferase n=1 Tax=Rhynchosporium agropyri TaxID=914238 RepID=A0A1E1L0V9_9HELO|nr:related to dma1, component of spindle assembly checkpoint [Rhynchosporium agropyri]